MDAFASLDATAQADLVRRKEVKPLELVDAAIARIERLNPQLNAVITHWFDEARELARGPLPQGPFTGVPFLIKDLISAYAGKRLASGSRFFADLVVPHDSELTQRYKRAGLVILGKTNLPEFGILPTTEPQLFGPTRNPWNREHTTGGSSGGAAAAVASGMVPFAHGGDGGGSIRIPASCCGLFGFKPTRGRMPMGPDVGDVMHGLVIEHALTRSVRDSAALLDATDGADVGAPYAAPHKARPWAQEAATAPGKLRIAYTTRTNTGTPVHPECLQAIEDAVKLLTELGHTVVDTSLEVPEEEMLAQTFMTIWSSGAVLAIDKMAALTGRTPTPEHFEPLTWALYEMGRGHNISTYLLAYDALQRYARAFASKFTDVDVWLLPTLAEPPVPLGTFDAPPDEPMMPLFRAAAFTPFTPLANLTGNPAMSVPFHWTPEGLPVGIQFVGRFGDEATLFRLAAQLEAARPWAQRRPPLFG
ncbi:amidase [Hyalangium rubrum]|uniref:Amidase n=1 Tax=Hyalangium rubrum TaxID=3103134 RepID=A0ABU5H1L3_9BACT|nr:amidase [Hyalangium sp. s54d21]MDY7227280.1 amidase [Hyalangium sp. s54d21]